MQLKKIDYTLILTILALSLAMFYHYLITNRGMAYYDEGSYIGLSRVIRSNGLFNFADPLRTYLYPLLIAFFSLFTDSTNNSIKVLFSIFQYIVYGYTVFEVARIAYHRYGKKVVLYPILIFGLLNPYLIQSTTLALTDNLSACFVTLSLLKLVTGDLAKRRTQFAVFLLLFGSVMIRPSNAIFIPLFAVISIIRHYKKKDFAFWKLAITGIICLVIFAPQFYMNVTKFHHVTPLIHLNLYEQQSKWAVQYLKYATITMPNEKPSLFYSSPFQAEGNTTIYQLIFKHPLQFVTLFSAHIFGLYDWGFVYSYISNLHAYRRILPSLFLYISWFFMFLGMLCSWKEGRKYIISLFSIAIIGYALFMGTTCVESRFGYPIYMMMLPFSGIVLGEITTLIKSKKLIFISVALALFIIGSLSISYMIDLQTQRIIW